MSDALRLGAEAARLARRLAELLPAGEDAAFLHAMAVRAESADAPAVGTPPLDRLVAALGLSGVERELVLLAGLADEHEGYAAVLRGLNPRSEPAPTAGLAARLLCSAHGERALLRGVLTTGPAVDHGLLRAAPGAPFFERSLELAAGLWSTLAGVQAWPEGVVVMHEPVALAGLDDWFAEPAAARAAAALATGAACNVLVTAELEDVAVARAAALCARAGVEAVQLVPARPGVALTIAVLALAAGTVPILRLPGAESSALEEAPRLDGHPAPVVLCGRTGMVAVRGTRPLLEVPVEPLSPAARRRMWRETLPELDGYAARLATRHAIEPVAAAEAAADVQALRAIEGRHTDARDVSASVRARAGLTLAPGVSLMRATASRDRLVVGADLGAQLDEAIARVTHQARVLDDWGFLAGRAGARGVRMLFTGPPGTGKTLAAEVMAYSLGIDLLVVDLSRVVSKWIGETEKNLAEVFAVAERSQAVLFFDEADALFGKRTEVSDAHDRYANLETAFLLARLERFDGLAILSTNLRRNIDAAFTRRLEFLLEFDEPTLPERIELWRCHLPAGAPVDRDVDIGLLASQFPVVGALIRNAAVAAGFLAAADGTPIRREHLVRAMRREYQKSGRAFPGLPIGMSA
jgi:ATPase family associated with various cellular activities (AAA)